MKTIRIITGLLTIAITTFAQEKETSDQQYLIRPAAYKLRTGII